MRLAVEPDCIQRFLTIGTIADWARRRDVAVVITADFGDMVGGHDGGWQAMRMPQGNSLERGDLQLVHERRTIKHPLLKSERARIRARLPKFVEIARAAQSNYGIKKGTTSIFSKDIRKGTYIGARQFDLARSWSSVEVPQIAALQFVPDQLLVPSGFVIEAATGVPLYDPFADCELIRIGGSVPWNLRHGPEGGRVLQRRAMKGLLPDLIRLRQDKSNYSALYGRLAARAVESSEFQAGSRHIEYLLHSTWQRTSHRAASAPFLVLEAIYRVGLIGAWLQAQRTGSPTS